MSLSPEYQDVLRHGFDEFARFVNPLIANRARMASEPIRIQGATEDGRLIDADGHVFEDFHGTQMFGHRRAEITAAVREYLDSSIPTWWPSRVSPFAGRLARRLFDRTGYDNAFFGMSGADAIEAVLKLARARGRSRVLGLTGAYHGCTTGATALMARGPFRDRFGALLPGVETVAFNDVAALEQAFAAGDVGALIVEPIQGEGGVRKLSADFVEAACELTREHGALLVADEVQTGLGRTGKGFLYTHATWPRRPDVVLIAKAIGGGLVPLSAMLTSAEIFHEAYGEDFAAGESHNVTFGFNTLGAVAGLATLDLITDELIVRVRDVGAAFRRNLEEALADNPLFIEVRGEGLMLGISLRQPELPWLSFEHFGFKELGDQGIMSPLLCHRLYKRGFFCFSCGHDWSVFRLQPRFEIPEETLAVFVKACAEELSYLAEVSS